MATAVENAMGRLVLVVGPSGAGKDALLTAARAALAEDRQMIFARRVVTRPCVSPSEDHDCTDMNIFTALETAGGFLLSWRAHGLAYGIPAHHLADLAAGRTVVANVSRGVIEMAEAIGVAVTVILVTAGPLLRARRIAARGRESAADSAERLARDVPVVTRTAKLVEIRNDGALEEATRSLVAALREEDC